MRYKSANPEVPDEELMGVPSAIADEVLTGAVCVLPEFPPMPLIPDDPDDEDGAELPVIPVPDGEPELPEEVGALNLTMARRSSVRRISAFLSAISTSCCVFSSSYQV